MGKLKMVAEIGINNNGSLDLTKQMIDVAYSAGCHYVKFQKRTVDIVYSKEELDKHRDSPWGNTNREQKNGLEFGRAEYDEIDSYCKKKGISWFASPWDIQSVDFLKMYNLPFIKIASALITDIELLKCVKKTNIPVIISTGMSTRDEIRVATDILGNNLEYILACTSTYPSINEEMNMNFLNTLKKEYPNKRIGFSNHSPGTVFCFVASTLGAEMIEFHITLDRSMYGSDQAASIETSGVYYLCKHAKNIQIGMGSGEWTVFKSEEIIKQKLRNVK